MHAILSIKPKYVQEIVEGRKKYEFRKQAMRDEVKLIFVYSSSPVKKIIGYFRVTKIIKDSPQNLWFRFHRAAGISREEFFHYYADKEHGFAIGISQFMAINPPVDPWRHYSDFTPPQSFLYLKGDLQATLLSLAQQGELS